MFVLSNLLAATAQVLDVVLSVYYWIIIIRALLSWVNPDPFNPIVQLLQNLTEPVLAPVRKLLPFSLKFSVDLSPLIVLLGLIFLKSFLVRTLLDLSWRFR
jgi:YggT family protein